MVHTLQLRWSMCRFPFPARLYSVLCKLSALFVLASQITSGSAVTCSTVSPTAVLNAVYSAVGPGSLDSTWQSISDPCAVTGVTCTDGVVTSLNLNSKGVSGVLPEELACLPSLTYLGVSSTEVTALPGAIGTLSALKTLNICYSKVSTLPPSIAGLTSLDTLYMQGCPIAELPAAVHGMTSLRRFYAHKCLLSTLPVELGNCRKLELLSLYENNLTALPDIFDFLPALNTLSVATNQLATIPQSLSMASSLQSLNLCRNPDLSALPSLSGTKVTHLYIQDTKVSSLPPLPSSILELFAHRSSVSSLDMSQTLATKVVAFESSVASVTLPSTLLEVDLGSTCFSDTASLLDLAPTALNLTCTYARDGSRFVLANLQASQGAGILDYTTDYSVCPWLHCPNAPTVVAGYEESGFNEWNTLCAPGYKCAVGYPKTKCPANTYSEGGADSCTPCHLGMTSEPGSSSCHCTSDTSAIFQGLAQSLGIPWTNFTDVCALKGVTCDESGLSLNLRGWGLAGLLPKSLTCLTASSIDLSDNFLAGEHIPTGLSSLDVSKTNIDVTDSVAASLVSLSMAYSTRRVPDLPPGLKYLDISGKALTTMPSVLPESLIQLRMAHNDFISLPSIPNSVEILDFSHNPLSFASLSGSFTSVFAHNCQLELVSISAPNLVTLSLAMNRLTGLTLNLPALVDLDVSWNRLTYVALTTPALKKLFLAGNRLGDYVAIPPPVTLLDLSGNPLEKLPLLPQNVRDLRLANIGTLTSVSGLPPLHELSISLTSVTELEPMPSLAVLRAIHCPLQSLPPLDNLTTLLIDENFDIHSYNLTSNRLEWVIGRTNFARHLNTRQMPYEADFSGTPISNASAQVSLNVSGSCVDTVQFGEYLEELDLRCTYVHDTADFVLADLQYTYGDGILDYTTDFSICPWHHCENARQYPDIVPGEEEVNFNKWAPCRAGYKCSGIGPGTPCDPNTYSTGGASSCTPCPAGTYSSAGSSTCA